MSQQPHDLQQERELLEHFRQHSQGEPSAAVDALILDAARQVALDDLRVERLDLGLEHLDLFARIVEIDAGRGIARHHFLLAGKRAGVGNVLAALLGIVSPFCSCSAVPLFIGILSAGVPLGVTFSFLISAPMVNEVALVMLLGLFGWKVAALYLVLGLTAAIVAGIVIGRLRMERYLEDWVLAVANGQSAATYDGDGMGWAQRLQAGGHHVREIVGKVWPYVVAGIALGAGIHGYVPQDFMAAIMGRDAWWSVPVAVLLGVPMYTNAAGVIPIVQALLGKGAALGTVLAFMMSVIALSAPEMIILRKALKPRLIATFAGVVALGILLVGYIFNLVL